MKTKLFTAIFVTNKNTPKEHWYKYHKIGNDKYSLDRFFKFAKSKGANEINFYSKETGQFEQKITIVDR